MQLATVLTPPSPENLHLAAQCGVTDIVTRYPGRDLSELAAAQRRFADFGLRLSVVEGFLPIENIKLGLDDGTENRRTQRSDSVHGATGNPDSVLQLYGRHRLGANSA